MSDDIITSSEQLAKFASDLQEGEIQSVMQVVFDAQRRYAKRRNTPENLDMMRDEILTKLAQIHILATVDPSPCFYGEPPVVEIIGKIPGDTIHQYGFDHERKQYEVRKAVARGEEYLGQKESPDSTSAKKRNKNARSS